MATLFKTGLEGTSSISTFLQLKAQTTLHWIWPKFLLFRISKNLSKQAKYENLASTKRLPKVKCLIRAQQV